jgi:hypothetical protein
MGKPPSREALLQRIAYLEDKLRASKENQDAVCNSEVFELADFENAAGGICVCHAIDEFRS